MKTVFVVINGADSNGMQYLSEDRYKSYPVATPIRVHHKDWSYDINKAICYDNVEEALEVCERCGCMGVSKITI